MNLYILEYKRTMYTIQFNTMEDDITHHELFTKKSELYRRIEEIECNDSIYMNYSKPIIYNIDLNELEINID